MRSRRGITLFVVCFLWASSLCRAQEMILEAEPGTSTLSYCDMAHNIKTCASVHVETAVTLTVGSLLKLDGRLYVILWMGPGYYLESGAILEPSGDLVAGLKGQRWVEIKPHEGKVYVSRGWQDTDGNRALNAADLLDLTDRRSKARLQARVKDVRLHVRVRPVLAEEEEKQQEE